MQKFVKQQNIIVKSDDKVAQDTKSPRNGRRVKACGDLNSCSACKLVAYETCPILDESAEFIKKTQMKLENHDLSKFPMFTNIESILHSFTIFDDSDYNTDYHGIASNLLLAKDNATGFSNEAMWAVPSRDSRVLLPHDEHIRNVMLSLGGITSITKRNSFGPTLCMRAIISSFKGIFSSENFDVEMLNITPGYFPIPFPVHKYVEVTFGGKQSKSKKVLCTLPVMVKDKKCVGCGYEVILNVSTQCRCANSIRARAVTNTGKRDSSIEAFMAYGFYQSLNVIIRPEVKQPVNNYPVKPTELPIDFNQFGGGSFLFDEAVASKKEEKQIDIVKDNSLDLPYIANIETDKIINSEKEVVITVEDIRKTRAALDFEKNSSNIAKDKIAKSQEIKMVSHCCEGIHNKVCATSKDCPLKDDLDLEIEPVPGSFINVGLDFLKGLVDKARKNLVGITDNWIWGNFTELAFSLLDKSLDYAKKNPRVIGFVAALVVILINHKGLMDNAICYYLDKPNYNRQSRKLEKVHSVFPLEGILGMLGGQSMSTLLVSLILQNAWSAIVKNKKFEKEGGEEYSDNLFDILNFTAISVTSFTSLCSALLICINARAYSSCGEKAVRFYNGLDKSEREKFTQALRATNLDAAIEKHSTSIADDRKKTELIKAKKQRVRKPKQFKKPKVTSKPGKAPAEKKISAELHSEKKGKLPVKPCPYKVCHFHKKGTCKYFHAKVDADHLKHASSSDSRSAAAKNRRNQRQNQKNRQQIQEKTSSAISKASYHAKGGKGNTNKGKKMPSAKVRYNYSDDDLQEDWVEELARKKAEQEDEWESQFKIDPSKTRWADVDEDYDLDKFAEKYRDEEYQSSKPFSAYSSIKGAMSRLKSQKCTPGRLQEYVRLEAMLSDSLAIKKKQKQQQRRPKSKGLGVVTNKLPNKPKYKRKQDYIFPEFHGTTVKSEYQFPVLENGYPVDFHSKIPFRGLGQNIVHAKSDKCIIGYGVLVSKSFFLVPGHYAPLNNITYLAGGMTSGNSVQCSLVCSLGEKLGFIDHLVLYKLDKEVPYQSMKLGVANVHSTGLIMSNSFCQVSAVELLEREGRLQYTGDSVRGDCGQIVYDADTGNVIGIHVAINKTASRVCLGIPFTAELLREMKELNLFL
jgi:hypothetical protein